MIRNELRRWRTEIVHKGVVETHHGDDQNVHAQGETDDEYVEVGKSLVLCQAIGYQILLDDENKVNVQRAVDDQVDDLFTTVPPFCTSFTST